MQDAAAAVTGVPGVTPSRGRRRAKPTDPPLRPYQIAVASIVATAIVALLPIALAYEQGKQDAAVSLMPTPTSIPGGDSAPAVPEVTPTPAPAPEGGVVQPLDDKGGSILAARTTESR